MHQCVLPYLSAVDSGKGGHGAGCQLRTGQCVPRIVGRGTWARFYCSFFSLYPSNLCSSSHDPVMTTLVRSLVHVIVD